MHSEHARESLGLRLLMELRRTAGNHGHTDGRIQDFRLGGLNRIGTQ
jgi:hypothetical protein